MRSWCLSAGVRLWFLISFSGCLSIIAVSSVSAEDKPHHQDVSANYETSSQTPQLREIEFPATTAQLLVQQPTPTNPNPEEIIAITSVKANPTEKGVEVILETAQGDKLQVANRSTGNNFIADITGGQLRLANGEAFTFKSKKPLAGITEITVINIDANTVRVTVVGEKALPAVELFDDNTGLIFAVASTETATKPPDTPPVEEKPVTEKPQEKPDDPIELVVTGEQDGYNVPSASTATRTDTPLRDIPQSIQVVPQEVLKVKYDGQRPLLPCGKLKQRSIAVSPTKSPEVRSRSSRITIQSRQPSIQISHTGKIKQRFSQIFQLFQGKGFNLLTDFLR